jgi:hypothetical protein
MTIIDSQVHAYEANTPKRPWHSVRCNRSSLRITVLRGTRIWAAILATENGLPSIWPTATHKPMKKVSRRVPKGSLAGA